MAGAVERRDRKQASCCQTNCIVLAFFNTLTPKPAVTGHASSILVGRFSAGCYSERREKAVGRVVIKGTFNPPAVRLSDSYIERNCHTKREGYSSSCEVLDKRISTPFCGHFRAVGGLLDMFSSDR
ncbi:hypothetical protein AVEN_45354-1 [Araneus ventricosus]|uniref:Uncharacterized protein n=1 Tax=Araneus ventricosus TaxID=182803 RepID=A0A4Y2U9K2_ARAVE|nr:hypothetical protein AVEN_45354-1 [Araneus ventricosus]